MTLPQSSSPQAAKPPHEAAWLMAKRGEIAIKPAPYTAPAAHEILVKNHALAVNPADWLTQSIGDLFYPWLKYPFILGTDVAGEVVEVGASVTRFKVGDRVLGHAVGSEKSRNNPAEGAFQQFTLLLENMASAIPDHLNYENAAVLPLGISTAACGLFQKDHLALQYPGVNAKPTGQTLLIWGGSTSVGSNAIQLAVAAGYEVATTASPRNFDYVKKLGASLVFDYASKTVIPDMVAALQERKIAGALAVGIGSAEACAAILARCKGNKFVSMATPSVSFVDAPSGRRRIFWLLPTFARMIAGQMGLRTKTRLARIGTKFIWGGSLKDNEVSRVIYQDFLPKALAEGRYLAAPDPHVIGHGLTQIPAALQAQKAGVSATKIVVIL